MAEEHKALIEEAVKIALDYEEHYSRDGDALTPDHRFGDFVMELRPPRDLRTASRAHCDQRIRAIQSSVLAVLRERGAQL